MPQRRERKCVKKVESGSSSSSSSSVKKYVKKRVERVVRRDDCHKQPRKCERAPSPKKCVKKIVKRYSSPKRCVKRCSSPRRYVKKCSSSKQASCKSDSGRRKCRRSSDRKCKKSSSCKKQCCKLLYAISAWADDTVTQITFIPKVGAQITWQTLDGTLVSDPNTDANATTFVQQRPATSPLFPLKVCQGDRFEITYNNLAVVDSNPAVASANAIAVAANLEGVLLKTFKPSLTPQPNQLLLTAKTLGSSIVDPTGSPVTEPSTANVVNTPNYVAVSPNVIGPITVVWTPQLVCSSSNSYERRRSGSC